MRLSTTDASFLYLESKSGPMHISSINILEGEVPFEEIYKHFDDRMHLLPAYQRKLANVPFNLAHPEWVPDRNFKLENHLLVHELPEGSSLEAGVEAAVSLNEPLLDRSMPLWKAWVITGVPGKTLILHQTHHCMIDGASGVELMAIIYDFDPAGDPIPDPKPDTLPVKDTSALARTQRALEDNFKQLQKSPPITSWFETSGKQAQLMQRALRVAANFVTRPAVTAPFNAGLVSARRSLAWTSFAFEDLREIRRALGGTINDVVLTALSQGVAEYLQHHKEQVNDQFLRIMCPVNVRTEDKKGALGNQVSAIFPMLPAWPMDVLTRLSAVCAETSRIKDAEEAQALTLAQERAPEPWPVAMWPSQMVSTPLDPTALAAALPSPQLPRSIRPPNPGYNFVCTNVPGPQVPMYLCGREVTDQIGLLILWGNVGFSTTVLSYNRKLSLGFICEPKLMPDVTLIREATDGAFQRLLDAARERTQNLQA